jgi:hypothetical protein
LAGATSSLAFEGVRPDKSLIELADHVTERRLERRPAADQDIIVALTQPFGTRKPDQFA